MPRLMCLLKGSAYCLNSHLDRETQQRDHGALTLGDSLDSSIRMRFSVHTRDAIAEIPLTEIQRIGPETTSEFPRTRQ